MNGFLIVLSSSGEFVFISNSIEDLLGLKKVCTWYLLLIIQCAHIDVDSAVEWIAVVRHEDTQVWVYSTSVPRKCTVYSCFFAINKLDV